MVSYIILILGFLLLGAMFVLPLIRLVERHPEWIVGCLMLIYIHSAFVDQGSELLIVLGTINVAPMDVVSPLLLILAFPAVYSGFKHGFGRSDLAFLFLLVWMLCLILNFVLGVKMYGFQGATNEFRSYLYITATAIYISTLDIERLWPKIERIWLFAAFALTVFALVNYADGDLSRSGRPVDAMAAMVILQGALIALFMYQRNALHPYLRSVSLVFFPLLILLQHRSVWVVTIFSVGVVCIILPSMRRRILILGTVGIIVFGSLAGVLFEEELFDSFKDSYAEALTTTDSGETSTFIWRLESWSGLLSGSQMDSPKEVMLGNPFGTGWERVVTTSSGAKELRSESPHNFYLQTLLRSGAIGLAVFVVLHVKIIRSLLANRVKIGAMGNALGLLAVLILGQMIFFVVYGSNPIQTVLLGAGLAFLRRT